MRSVSQGGDAPAISCSALFGGLSDHARRKLLRFLVEELHPACAVVVSEGEAGDALYLIVEGTAEVCAEGCDRGVVLGQLAPGDTFGELALLAPGGVRQATVRATSPLRLLRLSRSVFECLLASEPNFARTLSVTAERMLTIKFLKQVSPFAVLLPEEMSELAGRVRRRRLESGEAVIEQGEIGSDAYLIRSGRLEVILESSGEERRLATLGPGCLCGEAALLSAEPRNATVRAIEPSELLALSRDDLQWAMAQSPQVGAMLTWLLNTRARPVQARGIEVHRSDNGSSETVIVLKDTERRAYFRLSQQGWFVWQRLDGRHTMRMLTLEYFSAHKLFAPDGVAAIVAGLVAAGFVQVPATGLTTGGSKSGRLNRLLTGASRLVDWKIGVPGIDRPLTQLYAAGLHYLFTRPAQLALALVTVAGLTAPIAASEQASNSIRGVGGANLVGFAIAGYLVALLLHELGHAVTVKACGREVPRVGVGWYWFSPIAFVDTSDMWIASRSERIAVSLAGPYTNAITGSLAALAALVLPSETASGALWAFAFLSYAMAAINLNPLLEFDGYYVLSDCLCRPNLRVQALARLGSIISGRLALREALVRHRTDVLYAVGSLAFIGFMTVVTVVSYRVLLQEWISSGLGSAWGTGLAWLAAVLAMVLSAAAGAGEVLAGARTELHAHSPNG